jgi:hypothetical protein
MRLSAYSEEDFSVGTNNESKKGAWSDVYTRRSRTARDA